MAFAMGRTVLVVDSWHRNVEAPLNVEMAMLLDFAVQHPRAISSILPDITPVIRGHGMHKIDLSDAFAQSHFGTMRERFLSVIADLVARDLLTIQTGTERQEHLFVVQTERGAATAQSFSSPLSLGIRAMCDVLCTAWWRKNARDLSQRIRASLPDESRFASSLRNPFAPWLMEAGNG